MNIKKVPCNARIVLPQDAPFDQRLNNKLVTVLASASLPRCCPRHMIQFITDLANYGHMWECDPLQVIALGDLTLRPGDLCDIPDQFLRPLPDLDPDAEQRIAEEDKPLILPTPETMQ